MEEIEKIESAPRIVIYPLYCDTWDQVKTLAETLADKLAEIHGPLDSPEDNVPSLLIVETFGTDKPFKELVEDIVASPETLIVCMPGAEEET